MTVEHDLMNVPLFAGMTPEQRKEVARTGRTQLLPANTVVLDQHDPADMFYVILDGTVCAVRTNENGSQVVLVRLKAGDFFGELVFDRRMSTQGESHDNLLVPALPTERPRFLEHPLEVARDAIPPSRWAHHEDQPAQRAVF